LNPVFGGTQLHCMNMTARQQLVPQVQSFECTVTQQDSSKLDLVIDGDRISAAFPCLKVFSCILRMPAAPPHPFYNLQEVTTQRDCLLCCIAQTLCDMPIKDLMHTKREDHLANILQACAAPIKGNITYHSGFNQVIDFTKIDGMET
jgi:hypothetical protein